MENQSDIRISIPKPCHEDWNKMTPNEKGSFCMKCAKTVVDFTKKTNEEIRDFLTEQRGKKICGRFMNDQLGEKPAKPIDLLIPIHLLPRRLSFNKAFIVAVFIAFGTTLFSCSTQQDELVRKVAPVDTATIQSQAPENKFLTGDTIITEHASVPAQGQASCITLKGDMAIDPMALGEVVAVPQDTTAKKDTVIDNEMTLGKIKIK